MINSLSQLYSAKDLIWSWTIRTIRGRYQQSILGWLWAVLQPVASVAIFAIVFTFFIPVDTGTTPYLLFLFVAMVPWTFFSTSLSDMTNSLVQNMGLVTKIYFPREAIPIGVMLARFLDFGIAGAIIIFLLLIYQITPYPLGWLFLFVIILVEVMFVLGLGLASAAMNVFSRDVDPLLRLGLQVWLYASPIIYPVDRIPENLRWIYYLNPMAGIIQSYRDVLLYGTLPGYYFIEAALISLFVLLVGYWFFKRVEFLFADIV